MHSRANNIAATCLASLQIIHILQTVLKKKFVVWLNVKFGTSTFHFRSVSDLVISQYNQNNFFTRLLKVSSCFHVDFDFG